MIKYFSLLFLFVGSVGQALQYDPITGVPIRDGSANGATGTASTTGLVSGYTFTRNLTMGSKGADVAALQQGLIAKGYLKTGVSMGYFGSLTRQALIKWQTAAGISPASGYFGPMSRSAAVATDSSAGSTSGTSTTSSSSDETSDDSTPADSPASDASAADNSAGSTSGTSTTSSSSDETSDDSTPADNSASDVITSTSIVASSVPPIDGSQIATQGAYTNPTENMSSEGM